MGTGRHSHTATVLAGGRVIVIGGLNVGNALSTTEIFDATTGNVSSTGSMATARALHTATLLQTGKILMSTSRAYHTATLLSDGKGLVAGGIGNTVASFVDAQVFDPATGKFAQISTLAPPRFNTQRRD